MNKLHKTNLIPLIKKYYIGLILLLITGGYKNGILPFVKGYSSFMQMISIFLIPLLSFIIGYGFDKKFKNNDILNSKFYSLLFAMIIPISTNKIVYFLILTALLFIYNKWIIPKNSNINWIASGKISLVLVLLLFKSYNYQNGLESSELFQYSLIDSIFGHNISGLYISNTICILISLFILGIDEYYKKEIPLCSYGVYALTLLLYAFMKEDLQFLLTNLISSNILFALTFIAPLSNYTPYKKKGRVFYSILLGIMILPISLMTNFYEGIYISIIFVNLLTNLLLVLEEKKHFQTKKRKEKQN